MKMSKLIDAVLKQNKELMIQILESGEDINVTDKSGRSALLHAVIDNLEDIVIILIRNGADINIKDKMGYTPLHYASQNHLIKIGEMLLENGAKVDLIDSHGNTPLFRAVFNSRERGEIIELLLSYGANKDYKNNHDVSPYDLAKTIGNYDVIKFFE